MRLEGKVAIVTGSGSKASGLGTGKAIAIRFAQEGASLVVVDRHADRAEETRALAEEQGGRTAVVTAELADASSPDRIVQEAMDRFGRIDVLVTNAAAYPPTSFLETTTDDLQEVVGVNLVAPYLLSQAVIPIMVEGGGGSIIYISSVLAMRGSGSVAYAASKAGLMGLATSLANVFGTEGVRVNCVVPGLIDTPVQRERCARAGIDLATVDLGRSTALGIQGDAWDVAHASLFLASDEGRYLTGLLLPVDGGATTRMG